MSDAVPLPRNPHPGYYRKLAKDLLKVCLSADPAALRAWVKQFVSADQMERVEMRIRSATIGKLSQAQFFVARYEVRRGRGCDRLRRHGYPWPPAR